MISNIIQNINDVCHQLIKKPTNIKVKKSEEYHELLDKATNSPDANQEIVLESRKDSFYVHVKKNICITLYKHLSMEQQFTDIDKNILQDPNILPRIKERSWWTRLAMQKWDIDINFNDTPLSEKISEHRFMQKYGTIIKWDNCFIQRSSPGGGRNGDRYSLIEATQEDLKEILIWLTELL